MFLTIILKKPGMVFKDFCTAHDFEKEFDMPTLI